MRKYFSILTFFILTTTAVYGEDASVIVDEEVRVTDQHSFAIAEDGTVNWGFGIEYGMSDWLNLQLLWLPGAKLHPDLDLSSLFIAGKVYILGEDALVHTDTDIKWLRLSAALGLFIPLSDTSPDQLSLDQKLWGTALRVYSDFVFSKYFFINLYGEAVFYPTQSSSENNTLFEGGIVSHYLDLTAEFEPHFRVPLKSLTIIGGASARIFFAPWMNAETDYTTSQYVFSAGGYFGVSVPAKPDSGSPPVDIFVRYNNHIRGRDTKQVHWVSFVFRVTFNSAAGASAKDE